MTDETATPGSLRTCPECGESAPPDARFCEACGGDLPTVAAASAPDEPNGADGAPAGSAERADVLAGTEAERGGSAGRPAGASGTEATSGGSGVRPDGSSGTEATSAGTTGPPISLAEASGGSGVRPDGSSGTEAISAGTTVQPDASAESASTTALASAAHRLSPAPAPASTAAGGPPSPAPSAPSPTLPACRECGGEIDPDGYCRTCGAKAPSGRDHVEERPQSWVAAVSDRGIRHRRNEDAFAVAADAERGSRAVLVVCDGVSSAQDSDIASLAAAEAARAVLAASRARGLGTAGGLVAVLTARLADAADAASLAVIEVTSSANSASPPSCTFVAAVLEGNQIVAGGVGDSRAYWLPDSGEAIGLTVDDSWATELIAAGMSRAEAESGPQAHAITRWLGVDAPDHRPRVTSVVVESPGWLVVCSDGLWNYCSTPQDMAALVRRTAAGAGGEPLATATALVDWANAKGGHDNITVALARSDG